jgi:ABC-2 type transport system permease protein
VSTTSVGTAAGAVAPRTAPAASVSAGPIALALHAEWTKLRTLPGTFWLLAALAVLTIAVSTAASAAYGCTPGFCSPAATGTDPAKVALTGLYLGQVLAASVGVLVVGGEYGTGMIRVTLAALPRRLVVLGAKAVVVTGVTGVASVIGVLGSYLAGRALLPGHGLSAANGYVVLSLGNGTDLRAFFCAALYLVLIALMAVGITTAVRNSGAAIGIALGLLFLFPIITAVLPDHTLARHLNQLSPLQAGSYSQATVGLHALPLTPWQGLGVVALWAAGALILGGLVLRLRDALGPPSGRSRPLRGCPAGDPGAP